MIKVIKVFSDNYNGELFTIDAYLELLTLMSTGDFHSHKKERSLVNDLDNVITLDQLQYQFDQDQYI